MPSKTPEGPVEADDHRPRSAQAEETLSGAVAELLTPGVATTDVPGLSDILENGPLLGAFIGLFRGPVDDILLRLLVLTQMAERGVAPRWTPDEIRTQLGFLTPTKVENTLARLRSVGLLSYEVAAGTYRITPRAFIVLAAWSSARNFAQQQFGDLGFLNAQIAGNAETLGVPEQILSFALASTETLRTDIESAIQTNSMLAIRAARERVQEAFLWAKKGVELLERIAPDANIDSRRRETARQLAQAQSKLLRVNPRLDHIIHQMEAQHVRLGQWGLSTTDIHAWLRAQATSTLADLAVAEAAAFNPPGFMRADVALDIAEEVLASEPAAEEALPPLPTVEDTHLPEMPVDLSHFETCLERLEGVREPLFLSELIDGAPFSESSYRLSLLPLLNEPHDGSPTDPAARLTALGLIAVFEDLIEEIDEGETAQLTRGRVEPASGRRVP